jgi:hypothetical protein
MEKGRIAGEDALLRELPAAEVARRTGRTLGAAYARRRKVRLPEGRRRPVMRGR